MAGVVSPSMPVLVVEDGPHRAYATLNEGLGRVLRFGAFDAEVQSRLEWMRDILAPQTLTWPSKRRIEPHTYGLPANAAASLTR